MQQFDSEVYPNLAALDEKVRQLLLTDKAKDWSTPRVEYEISKIHPIYFMEEYGRITPGERELGGDEDLLPGGVIRFTLSSIQLQIADKICAHYIGEKYTRVQMIILKHRKAGISTLCAAFDYWHMKFFDNLSAFAIADVSSHTTNIVEMIKTFQKHDTCGAGDDNQEHYPPRAVPMPRNKSGMKLSNGSLVEQDTGENANPGTSGTISVCHMSENSKWRSPLESESSLLNSIPRSGYAFIIKESTAFGINKFAKDCEESEAGKSVWEFCFITWLDMDDCEDDVHVSEVIELTKREKELMATYPNMRHGHIKFRRRQIETLGSEQRFKQDFPLNSREPFLITGSNFFNTAIIQRRIDDIKFHRMWKVKGMEATAPKFPEVALRIKHNSRGIRSALQRLEDDCVIPFIVKLAENDGNVSWIKDDEAKAEDGAATMFKAPIRGRKYLVIVDVAEGKSTGEYTSDNSIINVFEPRLKEQVLEWGGLFDEEITAMFAVRIAKIYNKAVIAPEMNNTCGGLLWGYLRSSGYKNLYQTEIVTNNSIKKENGWKTTSSNKHDVCGQLKLDFKNGDCLIHSLGTLEEMMFFIDKKGKIEAASGHNDDKVMVASIASKIMKITPNLVESKEGNAYLPSDITDVAGAMANVNGTAIGRYL